MKKLTIFKDIHKGKTAVIVGNGPSLNKTPLKELAGRYVTFGANKIYRLPFTPKYYCIIDEEMMFACEPYLTGTKTFKPEEMFLRAEARVMGYNPIYPIVANGFSLDIANFVIMGGTVTYAMMQIAFYMGFTTLLLVGVDHSYPKTGNAPCTRFRAEGDDPDHFSCEDGKPYFQEGCYFNAPELEGTTRSYQIAQEYASKSGKKIINLTPGTHLDVFKKDTFSNWL